MKKQFAFVFCILLPVLGHAEPIESFKFGWTPAYGFTLSIDDPDGSTDDVQDVVPLSATAIAPGRRDNRFLVNITRYDFKLDASENDIGQDVQSTAIAGYYQRRLRLSRYFKPWLGLGPQIEFTDISARHTVDAAGFLDKTFSDRDEVSYALGVIASHEWPVTQHLDVGINAQYLLSVKDALEGSLLGVSVLYHWDK